ncbi:SpoIIIAH-like family protein [Texcoconibacillus texcoconensis]|uniref:Stage III sporulation protein AH n=1 Tax=Texcoconibacillus texcoconensis TaxID=1095777 RepID=A0A840QNW0_9BACI|nr:SpoIIIAH-like family protein [Texcoconibacillus texcoconensis]MBB5173076.1 stage III sporulation protein AH [Texcoconibacillus texcoconensis]
MVLKRQTVWLLTMLSLIIVLSVYYLTTPTASPEEHLALVDDEMDEEISEDVSGLVDMESELEGIQGENKEGATEAGVDDIEVSLMEIEGEEELIELEDGEEVESFIPGASSSETFDTIRLNRQDARARMNEEYVSVVASADASVEVQSEALDSMEELQKLAQREEMLESLIQSDGYDDALVITEDQQVRILVKTDELSKEEVIQIQQMAYEHLGDKTVLVGFQSGE